MASAKWLALTLLTTSTVWAGTPPEPQGQVIGGYASGKLLRATSLSTDGKGFVHLFRARNRMWGSQGLVEILESAGSEIWDRFPGGERLQVGDLSAQNGGFISGHASHQNGLDVDVAYFRLNHREQNPKDLRGFDEQFVIRGRISSNFDQRRNWALMKVLVASGRVNRIFVGPVIKNQLCKFARVVGEANIHAETLRRLRPYPNHDDHLHLRLTCPATSPLCKPQEEIPPGTGCPATLNDDTLPPMDPSDETMEEEEEIAPLLPPEFT